MRQSVRQAVSQLNHQSIRFKAPGFDLLCSQSVAPPPPPPPSLWGQNQKFYRPIVFRDKSIRTHRIQNEGSDLLGYGNELDPKQGCMASAAAIILTTLREVIYVQLEIMPGRTNLMAYCG